MASKDHGDWQSSKRSVLERNKYMFDNALFSDISFTCGKSSRVFHAHKYVLTTSSSVFEGMFYGDLAEKETTIVISDTDEESFKEFLRFLYTDDCKVTAKNVIGVMHLAKRYLISPLVGKCSNVLQESVKPGNVFAVLEQATRFDEKELEKKCWDIISQQTMKSLNTEAFCSISSRTMNDLLKRKTLEISEVELFKGILKWVDSECARQGMNIEEDISARRCVLGDSVYEIRFLEMSREDFGKYVPSSGILTDAEIVAIFQKFDGLDGAGLKWKKHGKRRCQRHHIVSFSRFDIVDVTYDTCEYSGDRFDALTLVVNNAVLFHGVRLFGDFDGSKYKVKFTIKDKKVTGTYTSVQDDDEVWGYDVMLRKPVSLLAGEKFTVSATIKGPNSRRGTNGKSSVKVDDITVTFENVSGGSSSNYTDMFYGGSSSNHTNMFYGQFYKIFLSKL